MSISLATKGYISYKSINIVVSELIPDTLTIHVPETGEMWVVLNSVALEDIVVNLVSTNTSVATVSPTVTVLEDDTTASFVITAVGAGETTIEASYNGTTIYATVHCFLDTDLKPDTTAAINLVPDTTAAINLVPTVTGAYEV